MRELSKTEMEFDKAFPQAIIRAAIRKALASDEHTEIQEDTESGTPAGTTAKIGASQELPDGKRWDCLSCLWEVPVPSTMV